MHTLIETWGTSGTAKVLRKLSSLWTKPNGFQLGLDQLSDQVMVILAPWAGGMFGWKRKSTFPLSWWPAFGKGCALNPAGRHTSNQQWLWKLHSGFWFLLSVQSLAPCFPNALPKFLLSEKRLLDYRATLKFFSLLSSGAFLKSSPSAKKYGAFCTTFWFWSSDRTHFFSQMKTINSSSLMKKKIDILQDCVL